MRRHAKRVLAFEPVPEFARLLRRKFARDVVVESIALSDTVSDTRLYTPVIHGVTVGGCATISAVTASAYERHHIIEVHTDRLDNVYNADAGFIKIDVEGHEQAVLDGAIRTISRCLPRILVEIEELMSPGGIARAKTFFARFGYHGYYAYAGGLKKIEQFSVTDMQSPLNRPALTAPNRERGSSKEYINNFIFLPPNEPQSTLDKIGERLHQLQIARNHAFGAS